MPGIISKICRKISFLMNPSTILKSIAYRVPARFCMSACLAVTSHGDSASMACRFTVQNIVVLSHATKLDEIMSHWYYSLVSIAKNENTFREYNIDTPHVHYYHYKKSFQNVCFDVNITFSHFLSLARSRLALHADRVLR